MARFKCQVAYDGTDYSGWQLQPGKVTIQGTLEERLGVVFKRPVRIVGSGRTDAGVHSRGQWFHFDADWRHGVEPLRKAFRSGLPPSIQIVKAVETADDFHARFSATEKRYVYYLCEGQASPFEARYLWALDRMRVDEGLMRAAAGHLLGTHDFTAVAANNGLDPEDGSPVKELRRLDIIRTGRHLRIVAVADGFLYKMVRSLTGLLVHVGAGRVPVDEVPAILASRRRTNRVETAPPQGLFMDRVSYGTRSAVRRQS